MSFERKTQNAHKHTNLLLNIFKITFKKSLKLN